MQKEGASLCENTLEKKVKETALTHSNKRLS